ncbi:hypothetical protein A1O7_08764 [Cladophialophora yegresii CBS 114405]|uniref:Uncharacterized protein n=1 Tax=Cladophialophora yegresii CBS 114405 TaxID=1182544 RepID=W9VK21_9EURO|nr:uncharacterized protein A1O7_08764 [Cladophialophora yegresii CBS 114405]EXJ55833.1 hypothetical protein A1O7_08764 [Cladophialophora yegresii CBS 114405]
MAATAASMWPRPQQGPPPPPQPRPPQSYPTWPQGPPQQQQMMQQRPPQPQPQWQNGPPPPNGQTNFVPPPLQRPQTNSFYPPPGVHVDMKTGKIQHDMLPPEMPRDAKKGGEAREYYEGGRQESHPRQRENSTPLQQQQQQQQQPKPQYPQPYGAEQGPHRYSQLQINVTPARHTIPMIPQGYAELDSETPGRYRPYADDKAGRGNLNSSSRRYGDEDMDLRSPPPAYRE